MTAPLDWISPSSIVMGVKASNKRALLANLAEMASRKLNLSQNIIVDGLLEREQLSNTALGKGVAVPHCKLPMQQNMTSFLVFLDRPVPYEAPDMLPVDIAFLLLAPEQQGNDYLRVLAQATRTLKNQPLLDRLRGCKTAEAVVAAFDA
jgi:PTS system nitrogen regulatory IIA component